MPRSFRNHLRLGLPFHIVRSIFLQIDPRLKKGRSRPGYFGLRVFANFFSRFDLARSANLIFEDHSLLVFGSEYGAYQKYTSRTVLQMERHSVMRIDGEVWFGRGGIIRVLEGGELVLKGEGTFFTANNLIVCKTKVEIEEGVQVAWGVQILDHDFHKTYDERSGEQFPESLPIKIKKGAWIGCNVIILKGVTIGRGTIIGAGSVVTRNMPDGYVCAGNPCKPIEKRAFYG